MEFDTHNWVALRPGSWHSVAGMGVLWASDDGSIRRWLEPGSEPLLQRLQRFDRWESHCQRLTPMFSDGARADAALRVLASRGLLIDVAECLAPRHETHAPASTRAPLIAIRAYRRPAGLARLLDGLCAHESQFGRRWRYLVIDDTPDGDPQVAAVVAAARSKGLTVRLYSARHRAEWLVKIARQIPAFDAQGPLRALLDPAIATATGARAWNIALLFGAGGTLTLLDDDFHLPWRARAPNPGIDLRGSAQQRVDHHLSGAIPEPPAEFDVLERAHGLCGHAPLATLPIGDGDVAGLTATQVADWRERRIGAVISGTYGAYAWDSAVFVNLGMGPGSSKRVWTEPFDETLLEADALSLAVDRPTLLHYGNFTPLALDLREFAPYAATAGKADDVAFLHLLGAVRQAHCAVEVPWLVGHAPPEPRQRRAAAESPLTADPNVLFGARVAHMAGSIDGGDPGRRWKALCALAEVVANDDDALVDIARRWRVATVAQVVGLAQRALEHGAAAPEAWRRHATRVLQVNREVLTGADDGLGVLVPGLRKAMSQLAAGESWAALWALALADAPQWFQTLDDA